MPDLPIVAPGYEAETDPAEREDLSGLLSNRCVIDEAVLKQAMALAMQSPLFRVLRVLEPILMAVSLGLLIWAAVKRLGSTPVLFYGLLLGALLFFYFQQFVLYPRRAVRIQLLRQASDYGTLALENRLWFGPDRVANRRGESDELLHMPYEKLKAVREGKTLIVLVTVSKNTVPLDKAGFENGTAEDFWALIAQKAPKARLERMR